MFKSLVVLCLLFSQSSFANSTSCQEDFSLALQEQVEMGSLSTLGMEIIQEVVLNSDPKDFQTIEEYENFVAEEVEKLAYERGVTLEGENKNGNIIRAIIRALQPATAHAGTHDGRGRCDSGCGRSRGNRGGSSHDK